MSKTKWYAKPVYLLVALALVLSLGIVALPMAGTVEAQDGAVPKSGTLNIVGTPALTFDPTPLDLASLPHNEVAYLYPFVGSKDWYSGHPNSTTHEGYNLAYVEFWGPGYMGPSIKIYDYGEVPLAPHTGDLGIRMDTYDDGPFEFEVCKLTFDLDLNSDGVKDETFDVCLPEATVTDQPGQGLYFWVAENGATYYANTSKGYGNPDMSASEAMAAGNTYLAASPPVKNIDTGETFCTIQAAIDDADTVGGHTIEVADGTYDENVVVNKSLLLQGKDSATTIIDGSVTIAANDVLVTGFTVNGQVYLSMWAWHSGVVISNNILENVMAYACHGLVIEDNIIASDKSEGIYLDACDDTKVKGNTITGFKNGPHEGYNHGFSGAAVFVYSRCDGTEITNNDLGDNSVGVYLATVTTMDTPANVEVHNNNIVGNEDYGVCNFRFPPGLKDPSTGENLNYWDYDSFSPANNDIDATCNWWGSADGPSGIGPGSGDAVSASVDYDPWLKTPSPYPLFAMASFVIDHAKIDFKKKPDDDKVRVQGKLELDLVCGDGVGICEDVTVTVGPLSETITMVEKGKKDEKWEYKRPKDGIDNIKKMTINWKNGKFDIRMDKADLTGVTNPVTITVQIGDDIGSADIEMREKKHHWDYKAK